MKSVLWFYLLKLEDWIQLNLGGRVEYGIKRPPQHKRFYILREERVGSYEQLVKAGLRCSQNFCVVLAIRSYLFSLL